MRITFAVMAALLALSACGSASEEVEVEGGPTIEFTQIGKPDGPIYTFVFTAPIDAEKLTQAAKQRCGAAQWCKVMGWTDKTKVAAAFPMTEPEAMAVQYNFTINRSTGLEEAVLSCPAFAEQCIE